ncbi:regulator of chromosome condensation 1/beta-lactamase-inhibitor protein II [Lipomyces arxii]|uniref:regulator of chromosome condensation 1/beta-lactamase-inhibitor protein II n=1 Tax=Lipomyces arxii TaxID=56418 RepID=UPI0034CDB4E6
MYDLLSSSRTCPRYSHIFDLICTLKMISYRVISRFSMRVYGVADVACISRASACRQLQIDTTRLAHTSTKTSQNRARFVILLRAAIAGSVGAAAFYLTKTHYAEQALDNIGVYVWGSNRKHITAPGLPDAAVKTPREIPYFHGMELRDLVLGEDFGVAISANGDLLQWGDGYDSTSLIPRVVLSGKKLGSAVISQGKIYALTADGDKVYCIPGSKRQQDLGDLEMQDKRWYISMFAFFSRSKTFSALTVPLSRFEKIKQIAAGDHHMLILTNKGKVFSCITGDNPAYSTEGQLGVPILLEDDEPGGIEPEKLYEIATLRNINIVQLAAGECHSIVRDDEGHVWSFGSNSHGQLGFDYTLETAFIPIPSLLPLDKLYNTRGLADVTCEFVAAGGNTSLFSVRNRKKNLADLWISGSGLHGQHGTGRYLHMQGTPIRVRALSGITEFSESAGQPTEIPIRYVSVGKNHIAAVLDNVSESGAKVQREFMIWGGNSLFQLGNGRRSNLPRPTHMHSLISLQTKPEHELEGEELTALMNSRRQLSAGKTKRGRKVEETVVCGPEGSAIYWKCT